MITAVSVLYFNVFVLIVQSFQKLPALHGVLAQHRAGGGAHPLHRQRRSGRDAVPPQMIRRAALAAFLLAPLAAQAAPLDDAYGFIDTMMDLHAQGTTLRLVQSFVPTPTFNDGDVSYTYDDDVLIIALLKRGTDDDDARARLLGDSIVYAQAHDSFADGRVRNAYHSDPFLKHDGAVNVSDGGSDTGNLAWTGMGLMQLYRVTNDETYLTAAQQIASFIRTNDYDTRGKGGYVGGFKANQTKNLWKSNRAQYRLHRAVLDAVRGDARSAVEGRRQARADFRQGDVEQEGRLLLGGHAHRRQENQL